MRPEKTRALSPRVPCLVGSLVSSPDGACLIALLLAASLVRVDRNVLGRIEGRQRTARRIRRTYIIVETAAEAFPKFP